MPATVKNFIMAINMPSIFFKNIFDLKPINTRDGRAAVSCSQYFANTYIEWGGKNYIMSLPLSDESLRRARYASAKLYSRNSKILLRYKIMPFEMNYTNAQGDSLFSDIVLHEIPKGKALCDCIYSLEAQPLFEAIDHLKAELARLNLRHKALSAHSVIVDDAYNLFPTELHEIAVGEPRNEEFSALREYVSNHFGVKLSETPAGSARSYEPRERLEGYDYVGNPFEGVRVVKNSKGYGYIDHDGNEIVAPQYVWAGDIREGRAEVETTQGMGLIDATGNYIIEPKYQIVDYDIKTGRSRIKQNEEWFYMDYEGRKITDTEPQERQLFEKVTY